MSEEKIGIPTAMQWRFKTIRKLLKETVPMTPNNGQQLLNLDNVLLLIFHLIQL
jgi:hypothetical protein